MYVDSAINYVVPSKVTSVPVTPVLTTETGRPARLYRTFCYLFIHAYLSSPTLLEDSSILTTVCLFVCFRLG